MTTPPQYVDTNSSGLPPMFNVPQGNLLISGGSFTYATQKKQSDIQVIVDAFNGHYISRATHDNNDILDPPKCHPGTRLSFLTQLSNWVKDTSSPVYISWLYGPAGAGKSAIARTLAEILQPKGLLAGSFFFHADAERNTEKSLVATLAQQLAFSVPETQPYIVAYLRSDPAVFSRSFKTQFKKLIVNPIVQLVSASTEHHFRQPMLMIIDGLDECKDTNARRVVLQIIGIARSRLQGSLKFLVASRPEHDIHTFFRRFPETMDKHINLINILADIRAHEDVYTFLCHHFKRIIYEHPLRATLNQDWPSQEAIWRLVEKSSGHFIYASTVIKYIEDAYDRPQKCLDDIINLRQPSLNPYGELDALYLRILSSSRVDRELLIDVLSTGLVCTSLKSITFTNGRVPNDTTKQDRFVECVTPAAWDRSAGLAGP